MFDLLQSAGHTDKVPLLESTECEALDRHHHGKWTEAHANHIAENRQLVEHCIQSLTVSHRARSKAIEDQVANATNDKIRLMKESELSQAHADYNRAWRSFNKQPTPAT